MLKIKAHDSSAVTLFIPLKIVLFLKGNIVAGMESMFSYFLNILEGADLMAATDAGVFAFWCLFERNLSE
jgi:hypothetical protein